ncbi:MAG: hypothetical protein U0271_01475 [Polyangiaceae bacterium]
MSAADQIRATLLKFEAGQIPYDELTAAPLEDEAAISAMVSGLRSIAWRAALGCAEALAKKTPRAPFVVPALIQALEHYESSVCTSAAKALAAYRAGEAVQPLLRALKRARDDFDAAPLVEALRVIAQQGDVVLPALESLVAERIHDEDGAWLACTAIEAIGAFGVWGRRASPTLIAALQAQAIRVSVTAAVTLSKLGLPPADYVPQVCDFLAGPGASSAMQVLDHLPAEALPNLVIDKLIHLEGRDYRTDQSLLLPFAKHADVERLLPYLQNPALCARAAELIGETGDPRAIPALLDVVGDCEPAVVEALSRVGKGEPAVTTKLLSLYEGQTGDRRNFLRDILSRLGVKKPPPPDGFDFESRFERVLPVGQHFWGAIVAHGAMWLGLHTVLKRAPEDEWANNEDSFALARCDGSSITLFPMPVVWPMKPNGANRATRDFEIEGATDDGILVKVESPFSRGGWGTDTFLFRFHPEQGWSRFEKTFIPIEEPWFEDPATIAGDWTAELRRACPGLGLLEVVRPCARNSSPPRRPLPGSRWKVGDWTFYGIEEFAKNAGSTSALTHYGALVGGKLLLAFGDRVLVFRAPSP